MKRLLFCSMFFSVVQVYAMPISLDFGYGSMFSMKSRNISNQLGIVKVDAPSIYTLSLSHNNGIGVSFISSIKKQPIQGVDTDGDFGACKYGFNAFLVNYEKHLFDGISGKIALGLANQKFDLGEFGGITEAKGKFIYGLSAKYKLASGTLASNVEIGYLFQRNVASSVFSENFNSSGFFAKLNVNLV